MPPFSLCPPRPQLTAPPCQAAFHSLYFSLREGRCAYFYLRCDAFTLLWRNAAAPHEHQCAGGESAAAGATAGAVVPAGGGRSSSDGRACYAVLAPSTRAMRKELAKLGVPFEMACAGQVRGTRGGARPGPPPHARTRKRRFAPHTLAAYPGRMPWPYALRQALALYPYCPGRWASAYHGTEP